MTGPAYPPADPVVDPWFKTIISQYANSPILVAMIASFWECIDQAADFDEFFRLVWNVDTAEGWGLDVWGRIVGVPRTIPIPGASVYFGFEGSDNVGFNQAPFYSGAPLTQNFTLTDAAYRVLIIAKALSNISDGSIPSINQLLLTLFPDRGNCYVTDGEDMTMTYTFDFELTAVEFSIVSIPGLLAKPAGVLATVVTPP